MPEGQILEFSGLTKRFGAVTAVENFTARVEPGVVTGFLGPNGAGKTTTLRMLLGLVRATEGKATIGGVPYAELRDPLRSVGAALEASSFHPGRTAYNHLKVYARAANLPLSRVDESLATVGLTEVAGRKVGGFSLGMRQRLGLAYALLGDPGVLVLDEPSNGLDPEGIKWMRGLLRTLASQGRTVLVSSHLLTEVQQTVDNLVIISQGRLVYQGSLAELAFADDALVVVDSPERAALADAFTAANLDFDVLRSGLNVRGHEPVELGRIALAAGIPLSGLQRKGGGLEEIFLELVSGVRTHASADGIIAPADDTSEEAELDAAALGAESEVDDADAATVVDEIAIVEAGAGGVVAGAVVTEVVVAEVIDTDDLEPLAEGSLGVDDDEDEVEAEIETQAEAAALDDDDADEAAAHLDAEAAVAASLAAEFATESGVTPGAAASAGAADEASAMAWAVRRDGETEAIETGSISIISEVPGAGDEPGDEDEGETAWAVHADGETESVRTASIPIVVAAPVEDEPGSEPESKPESEPASEPADEPELVAETEIEPEVEPNVEPAPEQPAAASFDDLLFGRNAADAEPSTQAPAHAHLGDEVADDMHDTDTVTATETSTDDAADEPEAPDDVAADVEPEQQDVEDFEDEHVVERDHPHAPTQKTESDLDADRFFAAFSDDEAVDGESSEESSDDESEADDSSTASDTDTDEHPRIHEEGGESR